MNTDNIDYKAIGKRIRTARLKAGMTQELLAEKAGLSTTHMSNIETGSSKLSLPALISLADALGVSVDELLCDNVIRSWEVFSREIQDTLSDCDEYEIRILADILKSAKESMRKNKKFKK